jgi:hypothetical protein
MPKKTAKKTIEKPAKKIVIAATVDPIIEFKLKEIAKVMKRSVSHIVEQSIAMTIARFERGEELFESPEKQASRFQQLEDHIVYLFRTINLFKDINQELEAKPFSELASEYIRTGQDPMKTKEFFIRQEKLLREKLEEKGKELADELDSIDSKAKKSTVTLRDGQITSFKYE